MSDVKDLAKDIVEKISELRKHEESKVILMRDLKELEGKMETIKSKIEYCENEQRRVKYTIINEYLNIENKKNNLKAIK